MLQRIEGPDPPRISCADVRTWLTHVFLMLPSTPVYSGGPRAALEPVSMDVAPGPLAVLEIAADVLGAKSRELLWLLTWARSSAIREARKPRKIGRLVPPAGCSVAEFCSERGIERSTFDRTVDRACRDIAAAWSRRIQNTA